MKNLATLFIALLMVSPAVFAGASEWQNHQDIVSTRLIGAAPVADDDGSVWVAFEAKMQPDWKTYWRSPGEAGLPVTVSVDGKALDLAYPIPKRFELFGLQTYGYSGTVVIPFQVPVAAFKAGQLTANVGFMVCKDICIPFDTVHQLPSEGLDQSLKIGLWLDKVPPKSSTDIVVETVKAVGPKGRQRLVLDVKSSGRLDQLDVFPELPNAFQAGKPDVRLMGAGNQARVILPIHSRSNSAGLKGQTLRITLSNTKGLASDQQVAIQ